MLPQQVKREGGYKIKGRQSDEAAALRDDANALVDAGAFAIVLELVEPAVGGIDSSAACADHRNWFWAEL